MSTAASDATEAPKHHVSELADPRQRFLSRVVEHSLSDGFRTPEDFLRHFPPAALVGSLAQVDALRVKLLVAATGTHEKIALKKSVSSATEDLELALAEQTTTPEALIALYPADDKVRHLDPKKLWAFAVEEQLQLTRPDDTARHARAAARVTFIVECALSEGLITLRDVSDGMTFDQIATSLPVADVREVLKHALTVARAGAPLTEERFLAVVPLPRLVSHVPLADTWERIVIEKVAAPAGFVAAAPRLASSASPPATTAPIVVEMVDVPVTVMDSSPDNEPVKSEASPEPEAPRIPDEDEVRRRVIERLRVIDRLTPSHGGLTTPVLLSIESMYAELWALSDDDDREACIRESFPNQSLLRSAMLALIELLDPSVDTTDPIIKDADVSGLIKIVLFEERRRRDVAPASPRSSGARPKRTVPPPLPRQSTPPPLPASGGEGSGGNRSSIPPALPEALSKRD